MEALAGIVKLGLTAVFDAQHGGVATGSSPVSWGLIDELFVNLTMPFKMLDVRVLKTHARHVQDRGYERDAPLDILQNFDPDRWRLITALVR